jgi:CO/xanthine dehydrogenase Mo-binding subunit
VGYSHEGWEVSSRADPYVVAGVKESAHLYAFGAVQTKVNIVRADRNTPGFMRSPPVVPYVYALESALDELAEKLGIDPVELRRINDTATDPINGKPYSSRSLMKCYDEAAEVFGWKRRSAEPHSMRDGDWLIGMGCATAAYPTHIGAVTARVRLLPNGHVRVQTAAHEIGKRHLYSARATRCRAARSATGVGCGRGRRQQPSTSARRGWLEHDREYHVCGAESLRCHPRETLPCRFDREGGDSRRGPII